MFVYLVEHSIDIAAPPLLVFDVLTTIRDWPAWSTMLVGSEPGRLEVGTRLALGLRTPQASYDFSAVVTALEPGVAFEWLARTGLPGVFDGRHGFELAATQGGCRLRNVERYTGALVPLIRRTAAMRAAPAGFAAMNAQIARRAEALAAGRD